MLVDADLQGGHEFIRAPRAHRRDRARLLVALRPEGAARPVAAGAVGYLWKETLTRDGLVASLRTAATGSGVLAPDLLGDLLLTNARASNELLESRSLSLSPLTMREQEVLRLVADGHPTREVAKRLSYSERSVKNVIHDVVTKFNARSRSQAVVAAVREGLI